MKVLHIINRLGYGGAEKLIEEALPLISEKNGLQVYVLLLDDRKVFNRELEEKGIEIVVVPLKRLYNPLNIFYIRKHIVKNQYDIVHVHLFPSQYWVGFANVLLKSKKTKFITTEHSSFNRRRERFYFRFLDRYIYSKYDCIISVSNKVQKNLIAWLKPKTNELAKFVTIYNGVDVYKYKNAIPYEKSKIDPGFNAKTKLICMVGRFAKAKDQETLIKAMQQMPENVHLLLVGDGSLKQQNIQLAKELGVNYKVHFLGFRNDVARLLKTSDIVVLSSNWEGFGLAAIEGMASGRPFVASRVEGLQEIVEGCGLLFQQGDYRELRRIFEKLIIDVNFSRDVSYRCLKRAEEFDISLFVKRHVELYKKLLK